MAKVNLLKGQSNKGVKVDLMKESNGSKRYIAELSWTPPMDDKGNASVDLDVMAILCDKQGQIADDDAKNLIFYNSAKAGERKLSACGAVEVSEDNRTGEGDGPDEWVKFDFNTINPRVEKIDLAIAIYNPQPGQNFGMVEDAKCVIRDLETGEEVVEYWLDDAASATGIVMAQFIKRGDDFQFKVLENATDEGLSAILSRYGIQS